MEHDNDVATLKLLMLMCSSVVKLLKIKEKIINLLTFTLNTMRKYEKR